VAAIPKENKGITLFAYPEEYPQPVLYISRSKVARRIWISSGAQQNISPKQLIPSESPQAAASDDSTGAERKRLIAYPAYIPHNLEGICRTLRTSIATMLPSRQVCATRMAG